MSDLLYLGGEMSRILIAFASVEFSSTAVIRSKFTAADTVLGIFLGGWLCRYSFKRTSKSLMRFLTALFEAIECDLQVRDLMQGTPEGPIITPQCLFKSRFSKEAYKLEIFHR